MRWIEVGRTESGWSMRIEASSPSEAWMPLTDAERAEVRRLVKLARPAASSPVGDRASDFATRLRVLIEGQMTERNHSFRDFVRDYAPVGDQETPR